MSTIAMPVPDSDTLGRRDEIIDALEAAVPGAVISDPIETRAYECDALTAYRCPPLAVVLPYTTEEVAAAMKVCFDLGVRVVPRGAGTSLAGGSLPTADSIILGTARLNDVLEIDYDNRFIRVQTGVTNLSVTGAVEDDGFFYAPDPSSQLACAIAGNIAMNSGGAHCLKYGVTTNNLMGVKIVMTDGEIVEIGGPHLDASGLDILGIICGSEGQLGIVTEATLKILPKPEGARPVLIGYDDAEVAGQCVANIIKSGVLPVAIEYMDRPCIRVVENFAKAGYPDCEALLIVEVEGSEAEIADQLTIIKDIAAALNPVELREAQSADESAAILFDANKPGDLERAEAFGADILKLCVQVGGCLTGEHGVGIEKRDLMTDQYSAEDLEAQMRVKDVFDPQWLLNPAKVFPLQVSAARRG